MIFTSKFNELEHFSILDTEDKQFFENDFVKQNSTIKIVNLICDGSITLKLKLEFNNPI
jgi:hypothetical protein